MRAYIEPPDPEELYINKIGNINKERIEIEILNTPYIFYIPSHPHPWHIEYKNENNEIIKFIPYEG
jgi:hypothetical protein